MIQLNYKLLFTCKPFFLGEIIAGWKGKYNLCKSISYNKLPTKANSMLLIDNSKKVTTLLEDGIKSEFTSGIVLLGQPTNIVPSSSISLANNFQKPLIFIENYELEYLNEKFNILSALIDDQL